MTSIRIDPRAGCGDDAERGAESYELAASDGAGQPYEQIAAGTVGTADARGYVTLPLAATAPAARLIRLTRASRRESRSSQDDGAVHGRLGGRGQRHAGRRHAAAGRHADPDGRRPSRPAATPPPPPPPDGPRRLLDTKLKRRDRKGMVKVSVSVRHRRVRARRQARGCGSLGRKRKPIAEGLADRPRGPDASTKTMRLTKRGRKADPAGQRPRVKLELRLPGGQKVTKPLKLRARR